MNGVIGLGLAAVALACATTAAGPGAAAGSKAPATTPPPAAAPPGPAAILDPKAALTRLFSASVPATEWFAPSFLAAVPPARITALAKRFRAQYGAYKGVSAEGGQWVVAFERGSLGADVSLDAGGRFVGLMLHPRDATTATIGEAIADLRALPGKVSVLVQSDGKDVGSFDADDALAVGSTFKLATLAALRADIDAHRRSWKDIVELRSENRSLPSGVLQSWPDGAPLTVYSLAALMISLSDNTATDTLIRLVGRAAIEPLASRNRPYLTTHELFVLKSPGNDDLLRRFREADEVKRRELLPELDQSALPAPVAYPTAPTALDVEWFFTARELCQLMGLVHDLPLMGINVAGLARDDWDRVAYKGGSEPGVLNMTTWVEKGAHQHCVSATWNANQPLEPLEFNVAYSRLLSWLKRHP
jgi:beta-lactamase class A